MIRKLAALFVFVASVSFMASVIIGVILGELHGDLRPRRSRRGMFSPDMYDLF